MIPEKKIERALMTILLGQPFYRSLLMRSPVQEGGGRTPTMATDGRSIIYNKGFVDKTAPLEIEKIIKHEKWHIQLMHITRRMGRDPEKWNRACDYEVNSLLKQEGAFPEGGVYNREYDGWTAEEIYNVLPDEETGPGSGGKGEGDLLEDGEPLTPEEIQENEEALTMAVSTAEKAGTLPKGVARKFKDLLQPKMSYREILRQFFQRIARNDYTWFPQNRRMVHTGLYLPSMKNDDMPDFVIGVDTSGSIRTDLLDRFMAEIKGILDDFQCTAQVVYCDAMVHGVDVCRAGEESELNPVGRGGTRFSPVFKWVQKEGLTPPVLLYFTDLQCNDFGEDPGYPVIWVVYNSPSNPKVPFGEVIPMEER